MVSVVNVGWNVFPWKRVCLFLRSYCLDMLGTAVFFGNVREMLFIASILIEVFANMRILDANFRFISFFLDIAFLQ